MVTAQPLIMGVLNVTPDSFSDGGRFFSQERALQQAALMVEEGADIIDVGGESSRPGAEGVLLKEELQRVVPVIEALHQNFPTLSLSVDTVKFEVAEAAVRAGATIVNDISGGQDIRLAELIRDHRATVILMHRQGNAQSMQQNPHYRDGVVTEVKKFLRDRSRAFQEVGVSKENIWVDPGIGFGKTVNHNLDLLRHLEEFVPDQGKLLIGTSRKSFLARVLGNPDAPFEWRRPGTTVSNLWAYQKGASVFRVHEVAEMKRALQTWHAILFGVGA